MAPGAISRGVPPGTPETPLTTPGGGGEGTPYYGKDRHVHHENGYCEIATALENA